jgi:hypothetical protein
MTGDEFESLMVKSGYTRTSLAKHWNMTRQTIGLYCKAESVEQVYADAIKVIFYEQKITILEETFKSISITPKLS